MVIFHSYVKLPEGILRSPSPIISKISPLLVGSGCQLRELAGGLARGAFALRSPLLVVCRSPQIDSGISMDFGGTRFSETFYIIYIYM